MIYRARFHSGINFETQDFVESKDAIQWGQERLYLAYGEEDKILARLEQGMSVEWSYGFNSICIIPLEEE